MTTYAVLPVKPFDRAKKRLATDLGSGTRRALVEAMVTDVLVGLRRCEEVDHTLVVTTDGNAEALANGYDAAVVHEGPNANTHSLAAQFGVREAAARGARRVLLLAGDCPALDPAEVDALLQNAAGGLTVIPDRHGTGTNGLLLDPPDAIRPAFGIGSRERHVEAARTATVDWAIAEAPSLGLDVDTVEDLDALRDFLAGRHGGAGHTRGMLARLGRRTTPS